MRAMLLSAGLSTRLAPLGAALPKPLLPVCDIPILRYGVALLVGHGIRDIVINLHHRGEAIRGELGDGSALGARIRYSEEEVLLETGGGLKKALPMLDPDGRDEPFLSMNGKLIFDLDIAALIDACQRDPEVLGTMVVRRVPDALAWGAVKVETDPRRPGRARVRDILGEGEHMFTGVHVTRPSVVRRLPDGKACMIRQGYLPWMRDGGEVAAFEAGGVLLRALAAGALPGLQPRSPDRRAPALPARSAARRRLERPRPRHRGPAPALPDRSGRAHRGRGGRRTRCRGRRARDHRGRRAPRARGGLVSRTRQRHGARRDPHLVGSSRGSGSGGGAGTGRRSCGPGSGRAAGGLTFGGAERSRRAEP
jgi:Nucleotidyl transferase